MKTLFLYIALASFVFGLMTIKALIAILTKFNLIDLPDKSRRSHNSPTPRGAGISLILCYLIIMPAQEYFFAGTLIYSHIIIPIFLPICFITFLEDTVHTSIITRLIIFVLCSILAIMWMVHPHHVLYDDLPIWIDLAISSFALLTFMNIYNFMDGIDGISAAETLHISLNMLALTYLSIDIVNSPGFIIPTLFIIIGWISAFINFNWHPAKIFLGDTGSISIGFLLGIIILIIASSSAHLFLACVISCLYYVADGGMTIILRINNGDNIFTPHLKHFFQQAVKSGNSHSSVVKQIMRCNIILFICSISSLEYPVLSCIIATINVIFYLQKFQNKSKFI